MKTIITALAVLLAVSIALCFAYKAKLNEANRYILQLEKK